MTDINVDKGRQWQQWIWASQLKESFSNNVDQFSSFISGKTGKVILQLLGSALLVIPICMYIYYWYKGIFLIGLPPILMIISGLISLRLAHVWEKIDDNR